MKLSTLVKIIIVVAILSYLGYVGFQFKQEAETSFEVFIQEFIPQALEANITKPGEKINDPKMQADTLIDLPEPYLSAGSFHPELYPHDASYSISAIIRLVEAGVLPANYLDLAGSMLDDFYFMVQRYGYVLNGNRSYYLTRSQANFLPTNVLEYYRATEDIDWLRTRGVVLAEKVLAYWTQEQAQARIFPYELFKWIAHGEGPCLEVLASHEQHNYYYKRVLDRIVEWAYLKDEARPVYARGFDYSKLVRDCDLAEPASKAQCELSDFYYRNDRASRVSGYDTNHLYGPFNSFTTEFLPVDHNAKLYRAAKDLAEIYKILGEPERGDYYKDLASVIKVSIFKLLWDEDHAMFFDYHPQGQGLRTEYAFAGAAYTLWAGLFDLNEEVELKRLMKFVDQLARELEGTDGLYASNLETGLHWDKPYTWPIQQAILVDGLLTYHDKLVQLDYQVEAKKLKDFADRISSKYIAANFKDWQRSKGSSIKEKLTGSSEENLLTGYATGENYSWNLLAVLDLLEFSGGR